MFVAEDVASLFLNVVSLLSSFIPLVVIQMQGIEVNGAFTLVATRVVDLMPLGTEEEEEGSGISDRSYWEQKASHGSLQLVDKLAQLVVQEVGPELQLNYTKHYIGMVQQGDILRNFVTFVPRQRHVIMRFKLPQSEELTERFEASIFKVLMYSNSSGHRINVTHEGLEEGHEELKQFIRAAHDASGA